MTTKKQNIHHKLNQIYATSICGNDILSSVLYVSGIAALFAGVYAPYILLFIGVVLLLYKTVYTEVVEALPVNGGAYNCLLNSSSKNVAAIAGVMTILSYVATAVISAKIGVEYLHEIIHLPIIASTIALLFLFALLVNNGIKDSAKVALGIFIFHIITLTALAIFGLIYITKSDVIYNLNVQQTAVLTNNNTKIIPLLFLAFSASLLGISGYESSANFVEEQEKGVFRKTLRNMLIAVTLFNPLMAYVIVRTLPYDVIVSSKDFLLSVAAEQIGGNLLKTAVVIDAFLVLSGAVLTAFVGVSGLIYRMASDDCLPDFLTKKNKKDAHYLIIWSFFLLCSSILLITKGELLSLAGVYTISFLGVMSLFAIGNLILRNTRSDLKRTYNAPKIFVILAFIATFSGMIGNVIIDSKNLLFFAVYFVPTMAMVLIIIYQDYILEYLINHTNKNNIISKQLNRLFKKMAGGKFVVFIKHPNQIYKVLSYINRNETGRKVTIVYCYDKHDTSLMMDKKEIEKAIPYIQKLGVFPHLEVELVELEKEFGPEVIENISKKLRVHKNRILIGSIHQHHTFDYDDLGGVRIIF